MAFDPDLNHIIVGAGNGTCTVPQAGTIFTCYGLHGCDGRFVRFQVAGTLASLRAISQTRQTPRRLALFGWYRWASNCHGVFASAA
jgi:hypothetical protein